MFIIDDILLAPIKGVWWVGKKIDEIIKRETSDVSRLKEKLMELRLKFEMDEITEKEYKKEEKELLAKIEAAQNEEG